MVVSTSFSIREAAPADRKLVCTLLARGLGVGAALVRQALQAAAQAGFQRAYLFSTGAGAYWSRLGFREVPVPELTAALPDAPQVRRYDALGWLPTEVAWRLEL